MMAWLVGMALRSLFNHDAVTRVRLGGGPRVNRGILPSFYSLWPLGPWFSERRGHGDGGSIIVTRRTCCKQSQAPAGQDGSCNSPIFELFKICTNFWISNSFCCNLRKAWLAIQNVKSKPLHQICICKNKLCAKPFQNLNVNSNQFFVSQLNIRSLFPFPLPLGLNPISCPPFPLLSSSPRPKPFPAPAGPVLSLPTRPSNQAGPAATLFPLATLSGKWAQPHRQASVPGYGSSPPCTRGHVLQWACCPSATLPRPCPFVASL